MAKRKNRELVTDTYVTADNGQSEVFAAGTSENDIDKEFLDRIDNESVWGNTGDEVDEETGDQVMVKDYSSMSQKALMDEVKDRDLNPDSNKKEDLVSALEYDDQARISSTAQVNVEE